ncbi:MAG: hypothetical protein J3Q66DRAFT_446081 [Benniella sp.]|nr:MAG: hypothetical protein J3Q66DRAFT_446081 [Benniella sp.]
MNRFYCTPRFAQSTDWPTHSTCDSMIRTMAAPQCLCPSCSCTIALSQNTGTGKPTLFSNQQDTKSVVARRTSGKQNHSSIGLLIHNQRKEQKKKETGTRGENKQCCLAPSSHHHETTSCQSRRWTTQSSRSLRRLGDMPRYRSLIVAELPTRDPSLTLTSDCEQATNRYVHAGLPSQHELVATAGPAQNGALIVFQVSTIFWNRKAPDVHSDVPMGDIDMEDVQSKAQASMANPEGKSFQATHWCLIYRSDGALEVRTYRGNIAVYKTYQHFTTNKVDSAGNPIALSDRLAIWLRKIPLDVVGRETPEDDDRDDRGLDGGI